MVQIPLSTLSKLLFTSITTESIGSVVPVRRSPKKSSHDQNSVHQFEIMESEEMFQTASLTIFKCDGSGKYSGPIFN